MKKILAVLIFFIAASPSFGQNMILEKKHGIRDIKLGSKKSIYTDLYRVPSKIKCGEMYRRRNENLYIGSARVEGIMYLYIDNTLCGIYVMFDNDKDLYSVLRALGGLYGMPIPNQDSTQMHWPAATFDVSATTIPRALCYVVDDFSEKCKGIERRKIEGLKRQL